MATPRLHYCTTSFNKAWTHVLRRFKSCSWPVGDSRWWGALTMVSIGNKAKRLSSANHTTKTIHHHHQCWYVLTFFKKTSAFIFRRFFDLDCFYFCVYAFVTVIMGYTLHWSVIPAPIWNFVVPIWNPCLSL